MLNTALPRVGIHVFWSTILKLCSEFHANICILYYFNRFEKHHFDKILDFESVVFLVQSNRFSAETSNGMLGSFFSMAWRLINDQYFLGSISKDLLLS